jgi:hypothetical protein
MPCVGRKELSSVPSDLILNFPYQIIEKHQVMPFRLEGNHLSVAMSDPTDFKAIEEIGFATGYLVKPYIAADVHISRAQSKYFHRSIGVIRYQQVADRKKKEEEPKPDTPATITMPTLSESGELLNITIPAQFEGFASLYGDEPEPDALYLSTNEVSAYSVDNLSIDFAAASSRDDVADVFIKYLGQEFTTGALFIIRGNSAVGWRAVSKGKQIEDFSEFSLLLSKSSVLRDVMDSTTYFIGTLVNTPDNRQLQRMFALRSETSLLVLPIIMLNKVVAVVLVTADMDALGRRLAELQKLVRKASLAFEMLIIKNKILMT